MRENAAADTAAPRLQPYPAGRPENDLERVLKALTGIRAARATETSDAAYRLALSTLMSPLLGDERLSPGDQIITTPLIGGQALQTIEEAGLRPLLVDCDLYSFNADPVRVSRAISPRTKAVMLPHFLGNPFDLSSVTTLCCENGLYLIEDCSDAPLAKWEERVVGSYGDISVMAFFPGVHRNPGNGGAVLTSRETIHRVLQATAEAFREPEMQDLQMAYAEDFIRSHAANSPRRQGHFAHAMQVLQPYQDILVLPKVDPHAAPDFIGLPLATRPDAPVKRAEIEVHLRSRRVPLRKFPLPGAPNLPQANVLDSHGFWLSLSDARGVDALAEVISFLSRKDAR